MVEAQVIGKDENVPYDVEVIIDLLISRLATLRTVLMAAKIEHDAELHITVELLSKMITPPT